MAAIRQTASDLELEEKKAERKECCKRAAKFTFSQLGLILVVCLYAVVGAFVFEYLEKTNEKQACFASLALYTPIQNTTVTNIYSIANSIPSPADAKFAVEQIRKQLSQFRDSVISLGYDGTNCTALDYPNGPYKWSFPGALLFSATVFTTVGYGNIAPKTFWGRLVCIAYAVLGIPLMLLCLANMGEIMADAFRYTYVNVVCWGFCGKKKNGHTEIPVSEADNWKNNYHAQKAGQAVVVDDEDDDDDLESRITVPLTFTVGFLIGYLFLGAILFVVWDDYEWVESGYFCFVTIATIGFGDIVPGTSSFNTTAGQLEMIGTVIYMVCGMAIISMAFNLMQEEVVDKFRWIGIKCGCIKEEDDDDQEVENTTGKPNANGKPTVGPPECGGKSMPQRDLGTGNRDNTYGRVAAPQPMAIFPQLGAVGGGYAPGGFFPPPMMKQFPSYANRMAAAGPNAEFTPPPSKINSPSN